MDRPRAWVQMPVKLCIPRILLYMPIYMYIYTAYCMCADASVVTATHPFTCQAMTPHSFPSTPLPPLGTLPWPLGVALSNPPPPPGKQVSQNRMIDMLQIFWLFGWVALTITVIISKGHFLPLFTRPCLSWRLLSNVLRFEPNWGSITGRFYGVLTSGYQCIAWYCCNILGAF